jgi:hypothetical protein
MKVQFFEDLQILHDRTPKDDDTTVLGDKNAKIGVEDTYQPVRAKHTLHEETNGSGELICEYAASNNMILVRTMSVRLLMVYLKSLTVSQNI